MISMVDIENTIYDWAAEVLGNVPVIWYHENAPRPVEPYVALHVETLNSVKRDYISGGGKITGNREFILLCQAIGRGSIDLLEKLKTSLERPEILAKLNANGIVFADRMAIVCISEVVDSRWEERHQLDLKFRFAQTDVDGSGVIEHANINGKVKSDLETIVDEININL